MVQLRDVNTTDIGDAIRLGCQAMSRQIVECVKSHRKTCNEVKDKIHAHS